MPTVSLPVEGNQDLASAAEQCIASIAARGLRPLARIYESSRALDAAFCKHPSTIVVVRVVARAEPINSLVLKTMVAQGDFDRAVLIYCEPEQPHPPNEIESWAIGDVDELAASLARDGASP